MSNINIEELRKQLEQRLEAARIEFILDLKPKREELRKQIEQKNEDIKGLESEREEQLKGYEMHRSISRGPKLLDEKVYKVINSAALNYIKQAREKGKEIRLMRDEKSKLQEELDGLSEEALKDKLKQKQEAEKANYTLELQAKQEEVSKQMQAKQAEIKEQKAKYTENMKAHKSYRAISGIEHLEDKTYKDASEKATAYFLKARLVNKKINELEKQLAELQEDANTLDTYLKELDTKEKEKQEEEISAQEDEMWAEYRKKDEQAARQRTIEEDSSWIVHNEMEKINEELTQERTQEEIKAYNDEQDKVERDEAGQGETELDDETFKKIQAIFNKKQPQTPPQVVTVKPTQTTTSKTPATKVETKPTNKTTQVMSPKPATSPQEKNTKSQSNNLQRRNFVDGVIFYIKNGEPTYEAQIMTDDMKVEIYKISGWNNIKTMKPRESKILLRQIDNPGKYYDQNIASILEKVDAKYGTNSIEQYINLLSTNPIKDESKVDLNIAYYFDNLNGISKENRGITRYIQKIAKSNSKLGRVFYEKSPSLFSRLWRKIKTLKLTSGEIERNTTIRNDKYSQMKMEEELHSDVVHDNLVESLRSGVQDPNFSISEFAKAYGISEEEVRTYIENPKVMGLSRTEAFRLSQRIDRQLLEHQEPETDLNHDEELVYIPTVHDEEEK